MLWIDIVIVVGDMVRMEMGREKEWDGMGWDGMGWAGARGGRRAFCF